MGEPRRYGCGTLVMLLFVGVLFYVLFYLPRRAPSDRRPSTVARPHAEAIHAGDLAEIRVQGGKGMWLAVDDESWDELLIAEDAQDMKHVAELMAAGKVFREENGTKIRVVKTAIMSVRVRVLDGTNDGAEGWIQREFVAPAPHL